MKKILFISTLLLALFSSCTNNDWEFDDFDYQTVYFAYQSPVRTITLGDDIYNTSLDNAYKCKIVATTGGVYSNESDINIDIAVDNSLCEGFTFDNGADIVPMPDNYYSLAANQITIPKGDLIGGVEVQLTDAFFADPLALTNNYVIPLVMTDVAHADTILQGLSKFDGANRAVAGEWDIAPKDYILYAVKYINPWHGYYLRRGVDNITKDGVASNDTRHSQYVEDDEVIKLTSLALNKVELPLDYQNNYSLNLNMVLNLEFNQDQKCSVFSPVTELQVNDTVRVYDIVATGSGEFVTDGEKKSWGNKDRDGLYIKYDVDYKVEISFPNVIDKEIENEIVRYSTTDSLVMRNRGVEMETFIPVQK